MNQQASSRFESGIDFTRVQASDALIQAALVDQKREQILAACGAAQAKLPDNVQAFAAALIESHARLAAEVEVLRQELESRRRPRSERIAVDPLLFIPHDRRAKPAEPVRDFVVLADAIDFIGAGWYDVENREDQSWRWSRRGEPSTLLLPTLGGGSLNGTLTIWAPFNEPIENWRVDVLVNDLPVVLRELSRTGFVGTFAFSVTLPPDNGLGRFTLSLTSARLSGSPPQSDLNDPRSLGVGLSRLNLDTLG